MLKLTKWRRNDTLIYNRGAVTLNIESISPLIATKHFISVKVFEIARIFLFFSFNGTSSILSYIVESVQAMNKMWAKVLKNLVSCQLFEKKWRSFCFWRWWFEANIRYTANVARYQCIRSVHASKCSPYLYWKKLGIFSGTHFQSKKNQSNQIKVTFTILRLFRRNSFILNFPFERNVDNFCGYRLIKCVHFRINMWLNQTTVKPAVKSNRKRFE